ncbi:hypothetical protein HQ590_13800, partial [bacterium]|nr:hypothetical protein [bacterium]
CPLVHKTALGKFGEMIDQGGPVICVGDKPRGITTTGRSDWAGTPAIAATPTEAAGLVRAACPPAVEVTVAGGNDVLCLYGRNGAGAAVSFCVNLSDRVAEVALAYQGKKRHLHLPAQGSDLVLWNGGPEPARADTGNAEFRLELTGPWEIHAHSANHIPLTGSPVTVQIEPGADVRQIILETDEGEQVLESLRIDGRSIEDREQQGVCFYDQGNRAVTVADLLSPGEHVLEFSEHMFPTILLAGDFAAFSDGSGRWRLTPAPAQAPSLERVACGYPFLHGPLSFTASFRWPPDAGRTVRLHLPGRAGTVRAHVDGKTSGICAWEPNVIQIPELKPGDHELRLEVIGNSIGLLRGGPDEAGVKKLPYLTAQQAVEEGLSCHPKLVEGSPSR